MRDAIRTLHPGYVIIENVPGLATKMGSRPGESALGTVIADLAEARYVGEWLRLRSSDVGAPHKRERIFILAADPERLRIDADSGVRRGSAAPPGRSSQEAVLAGAQVARAEDAVTDSTSAPTYSKRQRQYRLGGGNEEGASGVWEDRRIFPEGSSSPAADTDGERRAQHGGTITGAETVAAADGDSGRREWGIYAPAVLRWERTRGVSPPRPTDDRGRLNPEFTEWMMGFPIGWTEGETRTQRLRMLGNAVVVQVGEVVGRMLRE